MTPNKRIADDVGVGFELRELELKEIFQQLENGECDVAVAAISVTADRDKRVDFSHAYYSTGLGIAVPIRQTPALSNLIRGLLTNRFFEILGAIVLLGIVTGVLFWWLERRRNEGMFGGRAREGVSMGLWWSTIMLIGHKGVVPATGMARVLAMIVMIVSTVAISALTGVFASALTISQIESNISHPDDLRHMRTATVASSTSQEYLASRQIRHHEFLSVDEALQAMLNDEVDAVVYDIAMLKYRRSTSFKDRIEVLPQSFNDQQYAIALSPDSDFRKQVNQALLSVTSGDAWRDILFRYLGE